MTVSNTLRKAGPYVGTGLVSTYSFAFKVFATSDVQVVMTDDTGVETTLVENSSYIVAVNEDQENNPGGTITLIAFVEEVQTNNPLPTGYLLTMLSQVPLSQEVELTNLGGFYPEVINRAFDRATIQIQQLAEQVDRSVKTNISSTTTPDQLLESINDSVATAAQQATNAAGSASDAAGSASDAAGSASAAASSASAAAISAATASASAFPSGTKMLFVQSTAPTGWTKDTTHNDKALRIVSGTAGSGGTAAFSTVMASRTPTGSVNLSGLSVGATTLTIAQMPSHTHTLPMYVDNTGDGKASAGSDTSSTAQLSTGAQGGGGSHTHSLAGSGTVSLNAMDFAVQYVDVIIATKD